MNPNPCKGKTIIQGYTASEQNNVIDVSDGYYYRIDNVGVNAVSITLGDTGQLRLLAAGATTEFTAGNPCFPFDKGTKLQFNFAAGASVINVIVAYVRYEEEH